MFICCYSEMSLGNIYNVDDHNYIDGLDVRKAWKAAENIEEMELILRVVGLLGMNGGLLQDIECI